MPRKSRRGTVFRGEGKRGDKSLGEALKRERQARGLRQQDVCRVIGLSQQWLARVESGERRIGVVEFWRLASLIGFDACKVATQAMVDLCMMRPKQHER